MNNNNKCKNVWFLLTSYCDYHNDFEEIYFQYSKAIIQNSKEVFHNTDKSVIFWQHICFTFVLHFHVNESINQHHFGIIPLWFVIPAFGYTRLAKIKKIFCENQLYGFDFIIIYRLWVNLTQITIISTTAGRNPSEEME